MGLTREDYIVQGVESYAKARLTERGYNTGDQFEFLESYTGKEIATPMSKSYIAAGYNFDDGGRGAELGSALIERVYTIEFFVFGQTATWGRNLAQSIKFSLERDGVIPLIDVSDKTLPEEAEYLTVDSVSAERQIVKDPAEWERYVWTVHLKVTDIYDAQLA